MHIRRSRVVKLFQKSHITVFSSAGSVACQPAIRPTSSGCMGPEISENTCEHCLNMNQMIASLDRHIVSMVNYDTVMQN